MSKLSLCLSYTDWKTAKQSSQPGQVNREKTIQTIMILSAIWRVVHTSLIPHHALSFQSSTWKPVWDCSRAFECVTISCPKIYFGSWYRYCLNVLCKIILYIHCININFFNISLKRPDNGKKYVETLFNIIGIFVIEASLYVGRFKGCFFRLL